MFPNPEKDSGSQYKQRKTKGTHFKMGAIIRPWRKKIYAIVQSMVVFGIQKQIAAHPVLLNP